MLRASCFALVSPRPRTSLGRFGSSENANNDAQHIIREQEKSNIDGLVKAHSEKIQAISGVTNNEKQIVASATARVANFSDDTFLERGINAETYNHAVEALKKLVEGNCGDDARKELFGRREGGFADGAFFPWMLKLMCRTGTIRQPSTAFLRTVEAMLEGEKNVIHTADTGGGKTSIAALVALCLEFAGSRKKVLFIAPTVEEVPAKVTALERMGLSVFVLARDGDGHRLENNMDCNIVVALVDRVVATNMLSNSTWLGKHVHCIIVDEPSLLCRQQKFRPAVRKFSQQLSVSNSMVGTSSVGEFKATVAICLLDATAPYAVGNNMCEELSQLFFRSDLKNPRVEVSNEFATDEFLDEEKPRIEVEVVAIDGTSEDDENEKVVELHGIISAHLRASDVGEIGVYRMCSPTPAMTTS